jgi:hypothetical protein
MDGHEFPVNSRAWPPAAGIHSTELSPAAEAKEKPWLAVDEPQL